MSKSAFILVGGIVLMCMSSSAEIATRKQLSDRIQTLKAKGEISSNIARRLRWHVFGPDDLKAAVEKQAPTSDFDQKQDPQLDIRLRLLSGEINDSNIKGAMFQHRNSPSILTLLGDAISDPVSSEANPWGVAYAKDNNWLPAIIGLISTYRREEIIAARYATQGLELVEPDSHEARSLLQQLVPVFRIQSQPPDEIPRSILKKLKAKTWLKDAQGTKDRFETALLLHSGEQQEALKRYLTIIKGSDKSDASFYRVAEIYTSQGQVTEANEILRRGLCAFPRSSVLLLKSATNHFCSNNVETALALIRKCLAVSPEYPPAHALLARVLAQTGKKEQAVKSCLDTLRFSHGWETDFVTAVDGVLRQIENE